MRFSTWATWILILLQSFCTNTVISTKCQCSNSCTGQTNATISDGSCNGILACSNMAYTTVWSGSCNAYCPCGLDVCTQTSTGGSCYCNVAYICDHMQNSKIGQNSCHDTYSCRYVVNSTIGTGSCQGTESCWYCSNAKVPDGQCNSATGGWSDSAGNHFNSCKWCSNCKVKSTLASCQTSSTPGTVTAPKVRRLNKGGSSDQVVNSGACAALLETIHAFFKNHSHTDIFLQSKFLGKFTEASLDESDSGVCKIHFRFNFEHLEKKLLKRACNALTEAHEQKKAEFLALHPYFPKLDFACDPIDLNAANTNKPKKIGKVNKKKRVHSSVTPNENSP